MCLGNYPYAQCWSFLQTLGLATGAVYSHPSERVYVESLLTVVGTTIRSGSAAEKQTLLSKLRDMCNTTNEPHDKPTHNDSPVPIAESRLHAVRGEGAKLDSFVSNGTRDPCRYSMALKEHGDLMGVLPDYHILPTTSNPPDFVATLQFCGVEARGVGGTKKAAQHMAAEDACRSLQIDPWS